jgi:hypothetical protein
VAAAPTARVYLCEGEKDADRIASIGLLGTTVASQKWSNEAINPLRGRDVVILEDNDEKGRQNAQRAVEVLTGTARSIRVVRLPGLTHGQDVSDWLDANHTKEELIAVVEATPTLGLRTTPHDFPDEKTLAQWQWLYGRHLLRGAVVGTAAAGGTGKTMLSIAEALAMASGKDLLGQGVPMGPQRVLLINLEDNRNSIDKLIAAAMKHHGLKPEDVGNRLFTQAKGEMKLTVARRQQQGSAARPDQKEIDALVEYLVKHKIDALSIDPLIRTHAVRENDNDDMSAVVGCYEEIAERANCAVSLWHHTRKGNGTEATVESVRGAQAFIDACRSVRVLDTMAKEEAKKLGVLGGYYFREFSGKRNFAPPSAGVNLVREGWGGAGQRRRAEQRRRQVVRGSSRSRRQVAVPRRGRRRPLPDRHWCHQGAGCRSPLARGQPSRDVGRQGRRFGPEPGCPGQRGPGEDQGRPEGAEGKRGPEG